MIKSCRKQSEVCCEFLPPRSKPSIRVSVPMVSALSTGTRNGSVLQ